MIQIQISKAFNLRFEFLHLNFENYLVPIAIGIEISVLCLSRIRKININS
jgi:hypothetical protein